RASSRRPCATIRACASRSAPSSAAYRPPSTACWSISPGGASSDPSPRAREPAMELVIDRVGQVRCVYEEAIDLSALGAVSIQRASHVEPDGQGQWWADLAPV